MSGPGGGFAPMPAPGPAPGPAQPTQVAQPPHPSYGPPAPLPAPGPTPMPHPQQTGNDPTKTPGAFDTIFGIVRSGAEMVAGGSEQAVQRFGGLGRFLENGVEPWLGGILGGVSILNGANEIAQGKPTQGLLDVTAGGLGILSGAFPPLAVPAIAAGLVADGNGYTQDHGWWGQGADGKNQDAFAWASGNQQSAQQNVSNMLGGGLVGNAAGTAVGEAVGMGSGVVAAGGDLVGGSVDTVSTVGNAIGGFFGNGSLGTDLMQGGHRDGKAATDLAGLFHHTTDDLGSGLR